MQKKQKTRGRPKKEFKPLPKPKREWRGRPRKYEKIAPKMTKKILTKTVNPEQIENNFEKETTWGFCHYQIHKPRKTNFIVRFLIFSIIFLLFSLYKTFVQNQEKEIIFENIENSMDANWTINTIATEVSPEETQVIEQETPTIIKKDIISTFYDLINQRNYTELSNIVDTVLKSTNTYRNYFNTKRLDNFLSKISNEKVYLSNLVEVWPSWERTKRYEYSIKYKLKNGNVLLEELWIAIVKTVNNEEKISSIRCVSTWCSKLPFFNPGKY